MPPFSTSTPPKLIIQVMDLIPPEVFLLSPFTNILRDNLVDDWLRPALENAKLQIPAFPGDGQAFPWNFSPINHRTWNGCDVSLRFHGSNVRRRFIWSISWQNVILCRIDVNDQIHEERQQVDALFVLQAMIYSLQGRRPLNIEPLLASMGGPQPIYSTTYGARLCRSCWTVLEEGIICCPTPPPP